VVAERADKKLLVVATLREEKRKKGKKNGGDFKLQDEPSMYTAIQRYLPTVLVERPADVKVVRCPVESLMAAALHVPRSFSMPRSPSILSDIQYTSSKGSACD